MLTGVGLHAQFFNTVDLTGPAVESVATEINFDWANGSPVASIASDNFSARFTGQIESPETESFDFILNANDGARLWVNGQLLVDQFTSGGVNDAVGTIDLIAGRRYDV